MLYFRLPEFIHLFSEISYTLPNSPQFFQPQMLVNTILFCVSMNFTLFIFIFLDFTYKWHHEVSVCTCVYFTYYNAIQFHSRCCKWRIPSFSWLYSVPLYTCSTFSYPFILWWALSLFPHLNYFKQCSNEHQNSDVS